MRISNSMLNDNYLSNLNTNLEKMLKQQTQIATGKRITKLSDDPIGAINIMNANVKLERLEQYEKNVTSAQTWVERTENAILELNTVITSAYESAVSSANDYLTGPDKEATAALIGQLRDHALSIANSQSGDKYLFGGFNTINQPFKLDGATGALLYNGIDMSNASDPALIAEGSQVIQYEVAFNVKLDISISGTEVMGTGEDNIYKILDDFYDALQNDASVDDLGGYIDKLKDAQGNLLNIENKIGGLTNRLELIMTRHEEDHLNYTSSKSILEDVDQAEAIMKFKMTENIYQASLQISSKILQLTLVDFLD